MKTKFTPDDIPGLKLGGTPSENCQAMFEFCDVVNTLSDRLMKWRNRWEGLGVAEPASMKLQAKTIVSLAIDPK